MCSVENIPATSYNREDIGLDSMKVYRGLSVCSVENKIAGRIDEGDIRSMGFRKNSIRRKTRENQNQ